MRKCLNLENQECVKKAALWLSDGGLSQRGIRSLSEAFRLSTGLWGGCFGVFLGKRLLEVMPTLDFTGLTSLYGIPAIF